MDAVKEVTRVIDDVLSLQGRSAGFTRETPLLGAIPFKHELRAPSIADLSRLLKAPLLSAEASKLRHFSSIRLAVGFYDEVRAWAWRRVCEGLLVCCDGLVALFTRCTL